MIEEGIRSFKMELVVGILCFYFFVLFFKDILYVCYVYVCYFIDSKCVDRIFLLGVGKGG